MKSNDVEKALGYEKDLQEAVIDVCNKPKDYLERWVYDHLKEFHRVDKALKEERKKLASTKEELQISNMIGDSFWRARKLLNLPFVTVQDPGSDITGYILTLQGKLTKAEAKNET